MQNNEPNEGNQQQDSQQNIQPPVPVEPIREREVEIIDTSQWEKKSQDNDHSEKRGK